jgi:hypothetical protein
MRPTLLPTTILLAGLSGGISGTAAAQTAAAQATPVHGQPHGPGDAPLSDAALIANALSAAPASVAVGATVKGHDGRVLRQGTSDWVCMPDMPAVPNDTPMCLDTPWRAFVDAWMNKRAPQVTQVGVGYMLQGDMPVSNTDPFATAPTPTNQWIQHGDPHVMVLIPDQRLLEGLSTDPKNGGPFVMWKGTPYAHIMLPGTPPPKKQ